MSSFRTLCKDIFAYGIMGGVSRSVNLLLLPILTRIFSPEEYGTIDVIATMTGLLAIFITLTLNSAIARHWFESGRENKQIELVSTIIAFIFVFGILVFSIVCFLSGSIAFLILGDENLSTYISLGAFAALTIALSCVPEMVLRMQRKIVLFNIVAIVQTFSFVFVALLLVMKFDSGLTGVFIGKVFSGGLAFAFGLLFISEFVSLRFSMCHLKSSLVYSLPMFPAVFVTWINNQASRIFLLYFLGLAAVGVFGAGARIAMVVSLLVTIVRQAWQPLSVSYADIEKGRKNFYRRCLNYYVGLVTALALPMVVFSKESLEFLVPYDYVAGYVVVPWLIGATILHGSASFTNLGMMVSKKTFGNTIAAWSGASVNIVLCSLLIPIRSYALDSPKIR